MLDILRAEEKKFRDSVAAFLDNKTLVSNIDRAIEVLSNIMLSDTGVQVQHLAGLISHARSFYTLLGDQHTLAEITKTEQGMTATREAVQGLQSQLEGLDIMLMDITDKLRQVRGHFTWQVEITTSVPEPTEDTEELEDTDDTDDEDPPHSSTDPATAARNLNYSWDEILDPCSNSAELIKRLYMVGKAHVQIEHPTFRAVGASALLFLVGIGEITNYGHSTNHTFVPMKQVSTYIAERVPGPFNQTEKKLYNTMTKASYKLRGLDTCPVTLMEFQDRGKTPPHLKKYRTNQAFQVTSPKFWDMMHLPWTP